MLRVWAVRSKNICFGHVLVAVFQGQRRDAVATGEERHGRCTAGQSKYIRLYRYSGKLALAAMGLRRVRVVGRSFAAGALPLTHVCTAGTYGIKNSAWASGATAGGRRVAACLGRWRALPQRAARREVQKPEPPCGRGPQIVQKKIIFSLARLFKKSDRMRPPVSSHQNPEFYVRRSSGLCWIPPLVQHLLK